jgi:hypothetical protein
MASAESRFPRPGAHDDEVGLQRENRFDGRVHVAADLGLFPRRRREIAELRDADDAIARAHGEEDLRQRRRQGDDPLRRRARETGWGRRPRAREACGQETDDEHGAKEDRSTAQDVIPRA